MEKSTERLQIAIVIPAYNEELYIERMLASVVSQSYSPQQVVVVDDGSTDTTAEIAQKFEAKYPYIQLVQKSSESKHLPGSKVVRAFQEGFATIDDSFDIIMKLDADLILPNNYLETIEKEFRKNPKIGMVGGFAYILKNEQWIVEKLTNDDHIRGAFKAYRKACFQQIGGLKPAMGWDTIDELLCRYYGWEIRTLHSLKVKHLKPTGKIYTQAAKYKQGEAFYTMGYSWSLLFIASLKLAYNKRNLKLFFNDIRGYYNAKKANKQPLLTPEQITFVRHYRWQKIKQKIGIQ